MFLLTLAPAFAACPELPVPDGDWPDATQQVAELAAAEIAALEAYSFPPRDDVVRDGVRTDGLVIIANGQLVYERYGAEFGRDQKHLMWSASKSFTNVMTGVAVQQGTLSIDDSICDHITAGNPELCAVKVRNLMEFSSGIAWRETYEGDPPTASSVVAMVYGQGQKDTAAFVTSQALRSPPGEVYQYSSGDTNVLSAINGAALEPDHGEHYPWEVLFDPIGMDATWARDGSGTYLGSSYVYTTPRDAARFGLMLLRDGCWGDQRILPEGWVHDSTQVNPAIRKQTRERDVGDGTQGRQFWINQAVPEQGDAAPPYPDVDADAFGALGYRRQAIWVFPSRGVVIARTGDDRDGTFHYNDLLPLALAVADALPEPEPDLDVVPDDLRPEALTQPPMPGVDGVPLPDDEGAATEDSQ